MATIEPIHATQRGVLIGRFKASKTPVTIALKSFMVIFFFVIFERRIQKLQLRLHRLQL